MKVLHWGMLVAAVALGAFAWAKWSNIEDPADPVEGSVRDEQERVRVKGELDGTCPKETPIRITVANGTARTLKLVDFHVGIYAEGQPDDLASAEPDEHWTAPVAPFANGTRCRALPAGAPKGARYYVRPEKRGGAMFFTKGERPPG